MAKENITIKDFDLFIEALKPVNKIVNSAKIIIDQFGAKICVTNEICRCEVKTNSIYSQNNISICVGDLGNLIKILNSVANIHDRDYSNVKFFYDSPFLKIESKKFKSKLTTVDEESIKNMIDRGFKDDLSLVPSDFEFITTSDYIKRLNSHTFIFDDAEAIRIYLKNEENMGNNIIHGKLGYEKDALENSLVFEMGMITSGVIGDTVIILDFPRLNMLNVMQSDDIKVKKPKGKNSLIALMTKIGTNDTFINVSLVDTILVD